MKQPDRENRIRRSIIIYSALGILVISTIVAAVAITPLYSRLKDNAENNLAHAARISAIAVDEIISRARDLAMQVTSRTQIRKRLEAYNRGEIQLEDLVTFSQGKLADAMNLSAEINGISRLGPEGKLLVQAGMSLPDRHYWPIPDPDDHEAVIRGPVDIGETPYLLIGANIFNEQSLHVGTDIIVFSLDSLRAVTTDYTGLGETGELALGYQWEGRVMLFFPMRHQDEGEGMMLSEDSPIYSALAQSSKGISGILSAGDEQGVRQILAFTPVNGTSWGIAVTMAANELLLSVNRQLLLIVFVIAGLVLAGTCGVVLLLRPLLDTLHRELVKRRLAEEQLREHQEHLEELVEGRTSALCNAYKEMESFSYSVSHDLRAPLRTIIGFSQALEDEYSNNLDETATDYFHRIRKNVLRMDELIGSLLELSRLSRCAIKPESINMSQLVRTIIDRKREEQPGCRVNIQVDDAPEAQGDTRLISILLENLIENACKYSSRQEHPAIRFGYKESDDGTVYYVKDNGVGFDMRFADKLFGVFQRLHSEKQFEGTGIGLATVKRIIDRHGGHVWGEGVSGKGATFYFTLPGRAEVFQEVDWRSHCA